MSLWENIRLAWEGLKASKMRSLLTMLGIIIGIASVIGILTVGSGMSGKVTSSMSSLGATNITVYLRERDREYEGIEMFGSDGIGAENLMTNEMIEALRARYAGEIAGVALSQGVGGGKAALGRRYANVSVTGVSTDYFDVNSVTISRGRALLARDLDGTRGVAVVSDRLVSSLYGGDQDAALGQELVVTLDSGEIETFGIVGVYQYEATFAGMGASSEKDVTTDVYIPVTTAKKLANADEGYASFTLCASAETDSTQFAAEAADFLNRYYENNQDYEVSAVSMESMMDSLNTIMGTISVALSVIAGISLLVGGIGVMNIMLVSVTERTREIGTRKALGATNGAIRLQFVVESMIVCLIGGVIGMLLGAALGYFGSSLLGAPTLPSLSSIALAVGFSLAIGVFFGYYPANKAARLDPIEALRYE